MKVLLDTNVVSELFRQQPNLGLQQMLDGIANDDIHLSVVVLGELFIGARLLPEGRRRDALAQWIAVIERNHAERLLPVDRNTVDIWAEVVAARTRLGRPISTNDALIASTALQHGLTLVTRNSADFEHTGVLLSNPWV